MPTKRFFRLPEEKKRSIREAAIKEFARVPFEKASINQIIHTAGISRGSFYTYFEDKEDVVRYIFQDAGTHMKLICEEELKNSGGNYFAMLERVFESMVEQMENNTEMLSMVKNVFNYEKAAKAIDFRNSVVFSDTSGLEGEGDTDPTCWLYKQIKKEGLILQSVEEFAPAIMFGSFLMISCVKEYYENPKRLKEIQTYFQNGLNLLKRGMYNN